MNKTEQYEFLKTLSSLFDGTLAQAGTAQLAKQLAEDAEALSLYLEFVAFDVSLDWSCSTGPRRDTFLVQPASALTTGNRPAAVSANRRIGDKRQSSIPLHTVVLHSLDRIATSIRTSSIAAMLLIATVFYGSFVLLVWQMSSYTPSRYDGSKTDLVTGPGPASEAQPVTSGVHAVNDGQPAGLPRGSYLARLTATRDCIWDSESDGLQVGDLISPRVLNLKVGLAELKFLNGARVTIEGPCKFKLATSSQGFLQFGKLTAEVPRKAAGFTVDTPTAQIVDLGTEFGIEVVENGATEVQTFVGQVVLRTFNSADRLDLAATRTLSAGQAVKVLPALNGEAPSVQPLPIDARRFVRSVPHGAPVLLPVANAKASSEVWDPTAGMWRRVYSLVDGSGLHDGAHANKPDQQMWHSEYGKVENEWVLFDLGRPRRLHSLKVWNYNEEWFGYVLTARGLARAKVYASLTGKGNPLTEPTEWSLIIENCQLNPGTGTNQYDTPDVVELGYLSARL